MNKRLVFWFVVGFLLTLTFFIISTEKDCKKRDWDTAYWNEKYGIYDEVLIRTIIQIESAGNPCAISSAGAQGLFQVMPLHFEEGEDMLDVETNAKRGLLHLRYCKNAVDHDLERTLACYHGGGSTISQTEYNPRTQKYVDIGVREYQRQSASRHAAMPGVR